VLREVRAMDDNDIETPPEKSAAQIAHDELQSILKERQKKDEGRRVFPTSLSSIKSEYRKFCDEHGGPIGIEGFERVTDFRHCCRDFPRRKFASLIKRWQQDQTTGVRHWPAMAFAASQYAFRQREFRKYGPEPSPSKVRRMLKEIENSAHKLGLSLAKLQETSFQISDDSSTWAMPHIRWLDQFISQAAAGKPSRDVIEDGEHMALVHFEKMAFINRVAGIQAAAIESLKRLDPALLTHRRGAMNRALRTLVSMATPIWKSLSGRKPSINRVAKGQPDFVTFVQELAKIAGGPTASSKQVEVAFKSLAPPTTRNSPSQSGV
jgi:hypothetical protein